MSIETNSNTATLTVSTQAEADGWVPKLLAMTEYTVPPTRGIVFVTRRVLVIDGTTDEIDLYQCGAIERCRGDGQGDHVVHWHEGRIDAVIVRNCRADIADDLEVECGHAGIEFTRES